MQLFVDGIEVCFHGSISVVSADNLASQDFGGFKAINAAVRKCHYCMTTETEMQLKVHIITRSV